MEQLANATVLKELAEEVLELRRKLALASQLLGKHAAFLDQVTAAPSTADVTIEVQTTPSGVCQSIFTVMNGQRTQVWAAPRPVAGPHPAEAVQVLDWMGDFDIALHRPAFDSLVGLVAQGAEHRRSQSSKNFVDLLASIQTATRP